MHLHHHGRASLSSCPQLCCHQSRCSYYIYCQRHMPPGVSAHASHLSVPKAWLRAGGYQYHYLSNWPFDPSNPLLPTDPNLPSNGAIHICCQILKEVLSGAAESEVASLFHNGKEACSLGRSKPTAAQQLVSLMTVSNKSPPRKSSTCVSIGSAAAYAMANF